MNDRSAPAGAQPAVAVALAAGLCGGIQPKINAVLGTRVDSSLVASLVNFTAALAVVAIFLVLRPGTREMLRHLQSWRVPSWTFMAGLGGAFVVITGALAVET
ncbi:MAG: DMT family transporter, partial [Acidimicrobiia bacterium]